MAELMLPQNSKVRPGKRHAAPQGAKRTRTLRIYRYDPETGENPRWDSYEIDLDHTGPMVLDALIAIKNTIELHADVPPFLPRRRVRFVRDEHLRAQHACLHQGHG